MQEPSVIALDKAGGVDTEIGDPVSDITVSNIWAVDGATSKMLQPWPHYRKEIAEGAAEGNFANHCPHCGAIQEDYLLHSEPGDVFFGIVKGRPGAIEFTPLEGKIQMSGDYGFEV